MKFKEILISFLFLFNLPIVFASSQNDSLLNELSLTIKNNDSYVQEKYDQIERLKQSLTERENSALQRQFHIYNELYKEYRTFRYDSAFSYARKLQHIADLLNDPAKRTYAQLKLSHTLLSSGMYKEALDSLSTLNAGTMPDSIKIDYYALKARTYYDLSGYTQDAYYTPRYAEEGEAYVDSALALLGQNTLQFYALRGMKLEIGMEAEKARLDFQTILDKFNPSLNQYAMAANSLGNIYYKRGEKDKAIEMMAKAAIADMKASVKEGVALMTLAEFLYHNGDEARAYYYIKQALKDAEFYGAKQRKIQVAAILPVIEGERLATVEEQRSRLVVYASAITVLAVLVVVFAFIIFRQLKQLRLAKQTVTEANISLQEAYNKVKEMNDKLQHANDALLEANKIKEGYIGYSFNLYSEYICKIEKLKKSIEKKLMARKFDDISYTMESINLKKEREDLYESFDRIFVQLFPNFVAEFNTFFKEEDRIQLRDHQSLNIELRIFALIRMGIHDHEQIASILEYSVRTIYNYKTKVKNRSILSNEEFERRIMEIKAF
jgi:hypothetical protein